MAFCDPRCCTARQAVHTPPRRREELSARPSRAATRAAVGLAAALRDNLREAATGCPGPLQARARHAPARLSATRRMRGGGH